MLTTTDRIEHDCPWIGRCRCAEDGSLCTCSHQHGDHGVAPIEFYSGCTQCECEAFDSAHLEALPKREQTLADVIDELALW